MPDQATLLRDEIRRLARKEIKAQISALKNSVSQQRREIATLKRLLEEQESKVAFLEAQERKRIAQPVVSEETVETARFSPRSVRAQRQRLKLSAEEYAKLVGVSPQTIYLWERGKSRPRKAQLAALVSVRSFGRREALERLKVLGAGESRPSPKPRKSSRKQTKK